ncbi:hypothetical protein OZD66_05355, partial [Wolbachia endosymbiont of Drosophila baimaii]|nr:hypothetical protein [Wolbachia endosymbiont of Drosophila baimaii]
MIVGRKVLEHDPEKVCENKNIHADHKEHLVYREDNNGIAFLIIVRTGHRKAESTARRKDSNRGMFFL